MSFYFFSFSIGNYDEAIQLFFLIAIAVEDPLLAARTESTTHSSCLIYVFLFLIQIFVMDRIHGLRHFNMLDEKRDYTCTQGKQVHYLSRWSWCDCLHSLACLPLYLFTVFIVCILFVFLGSTCHYVLRSVYFPIFTVFF